MNTPYFNELFFSRSTMKSEYFGWSESGLRSSKATSSCRASPSKRFLPLPAPEARTAANCWIPRTELIKSWIDLSRLVCPAAERDISNTLKMQERPHSFEVAVCLRKDISKLTRLQLTVGMLGIFLNLVAMTAKTGKILSSGLLLSSASLHLRILTGQPLELNHATM